MLVLRDGTMIYNAATLREFMESVGFDCWHLQKQDLLNLMGEGGNTKEALHNEISGLLDEIDEYQQRIQDLEDEIDELKSAQRKANENSTVTLEEIMNN